MTGDLGSEASFSEGERHFSLGRYAEALDAYNRALQADPMFAEAWRERGAALLRLGRDYEAIRSLDRCLELQRPLSLLSGKIVRGRGGLRSRLGAESGGFPILAE